MRSIILSRSDMDVLLRHALDGMPNEACAILLGVGNRVKEVFLTENKERSPAAFTVPPEQLLEAYKMAEARKWAVVGIFHSHPSSHAYPSETDKRFMQVNPDTVWIIYSAIHDAFRGHVLESDGAIAEVEVVWCADPKLADTRLRSDSR